ncbi:hypothetical protein ACLOJK_000894 [Asimina triloba]
MEQVDSGSSGDRECLHESAFDIERVVKERGMKVLPGNGWQDCDGMWSELPCLQFFYKDRKAGVHDDNEGTLKILAETIFPELLETLVNDDANHVTPKTTRFNELLHGTGSLVSLLRN